VTLLPRTPAGRITLAISLSLLVHIVMLLAPLVKLPPSELPLPPLVAKLEPLPVIAAPPIPRKIEKPKAKPKPVQSKFYIYNHINFTYLYITIISPPAPKRLRRAGHELENRLEILD